MNKKLIIAAGLIALIAFTTVIMTAIAFVATATVGRIFGRAAATAATAASFILSGIRVVRHLDRQP